VSSGEERKQLLEKAEKGFSEFAVGDGRSDLFIESVLGRGLAYLELGEAQDAERDFKFVIDSKEATQERKVKARIGLVDAYLRAGNADKAIEASKGFGGVSGEAASYLKFLRIRALLLGAKGGPNAGRNREEALALVEQLRRQGGAWGQRADALLSSAMNDPSLWAGAATGTFGQWQVARLAMSKNDYKQALPLLQKLVASDDPEAVKRRGDASYLLAVAQFQTGQPGEAAKTLQAALPNVGKEFQADAYYLRFKAVETQAAKDATPEQTAALRLAATEYVEKFPDHRSAYEAYLRLGEILQGERKFPEAIASYDKVKGDPVFELRARFAVLQSQFEQLGELKKDDRAQRDQLLKTIGEGLPPVIDAAREADKKGGDAAAQAHEILGKALVLQAAYLAFVPSEKPDESDERILVLLKDFEKTYPNRSDLFGAATRFRLDALERLGRYQEAEAELKAHGAALAGPDYAEARDALAQRFLRDSGRAINKQDQQGAQAAQAVALQLLEMGLGQGGAADKKQLTLARLYLETGETEKAKQAYEQVLAADPKSVVALKGLARLAETAKQPNAVDAWVRYGAVTTPGDPAWYDAQYEIARAALAAGDKKRSCDILTQVKTAIIGLGDKDLRQKLNQLFGEACG
jgi:tetratricopeptide (TPR) repeat protein